MRTTWSILAVAACLHTVLAHGNHGSSSSSDSSSDGPRPDDWALWHLEEEHHISNFDAPSFFTLHDFNNDGLWTADEIRRMYGMDDDSNKHIPLDTKYGAVREVMRLFDPAKSGSISKTAFVQKYREGVKLPDFNLGPGHHGDVEYEYEIHHFEKFHGPDTKEEDLTHPEDIEHFRMHDLMEDEEQRILTEQRQNIVEKNIPAKFRRAGT